MDKQNRLLLSDITIWFVVLFLTWYIGRYLGNRSLGIIILVVGILGNGVVHHILYRNLEQEVGNIIMRDISLETTDNSQLEKQMPIRIDEWDEKDGDCLWWKFPIEESPYCGSPLNENFPDEVTHFTRIIMPEEPWS